MSDRKYGTLAESFRWEGDRSENKRLSSEAALELTLRILQVQS